MRNIYKVLFFTLIISFFIMRPSSSYADWHGHDGHGHDEHGHDGHGHDGDRHEHEHHERSYIGFNFSVWPDNYYYSAPYYPPADEVLVSPPVYQTVVQQPVPVIQPLEDSFTVNIPNDKGGYTAITLKRSGNGYIGPQGEFYAQFPSVAQLKVIYGK